MLNIWSVFHTTKTETNTNIFIIHVFTILIFVVDDNEMNVLQNV